MDKPGLPGETDLQGGGMTDCLALSQHLRFYLKARTMSCKMEELQFLDTSEMWSMCGQNGWERDSHLLDL